MIKGNWYTLHDDTCYWLIEFSHIDQGMVVSYATICVNYQSEDIDYDHSYRQGSRVAKVGRLNPTPPTSNELKIINHFIGEQYD